MAVEAAGVEAAWLARRLLRLRELRRLAGELEALRVWAGVLEARQARLETLAEVVEE